MKKLTLAALGLVALATLPARAADWSDTYLGYRMGNNFREPGIEPSIQKKILTLGHASGYSLGSNFFVVDMLKSDSNDPINTDSPGVSGGAQEVYVVYQTTLSLGKVFKTKLEWGPISDVAFTAGFDYNSKNTQFAPSVLKLMAGPTLSFKVPGFFTAGLLYYKEKNHNAFGGYATDKGGALDVDFDPTYRLGLAWGINAPLGSVDTLVKGFANLTGAKGKDGSAVETKAETQVNLFWMFDISPLLGAKKGTWQIGPGYEFWNNKFGEPTFDKTITDVQMANPRTSTVMASIEFHF